MIIDKTISNINRIRELINVLIRYGFEDIVASTALKKLVPQSTKISWQRDQRSVFEYTHWERIRLILEELGPTYIKLAQIISNRADIVPEPLIRELEKLQNDVPPFDFEVAKQIIKKEFGKEIDEIFEFFDEKPLGSASIGQVHRARLHGGEEVVIKLQRPDARKKVETDLSLIREFVKLTENYFRQNGILNPLDIVDTFEKTMYKELDYSNEARNIEQFKKFYKNERKFYVPRVYKQLSTKRALILEYVRGCKITDVETIVSWGLEPRKIAERGMDIYLKQIFEHGYFHADPHPGNVLVQKDGVLSLIDYGMVGKLMDKDRMSFAGVFISMAQRDSKKMAFHFRNLSIDSEIDDMRRFEYDLNELIEDFASLDVDEMRMADLAQALQKIIYQYRLKVPGGIFLILRALIILEGIGKSIYPDFKTFEFVRPYGKKILAEQYSFSNISKEVIENAIQIFGYLTTIPSDLKLLFRKIKKGKLLIQVENYGYEEITQSFDKGSKRISLALIILGLLVSSSLFLLSNRKSQLFSFDDLYTLGLGSYLAALILIGFFLIGYLSKSKSKRKPEE
ncbi:MAG: AarF/ABC1/UbiB kinase family protein [Bacteroidota bacterium]